MNAVSTVILHGLTKDKHGSATPLVLRRIIAPPLKITYLDDPEDVESEDMPPPRLPSRLPPPGEHTLTLNINGRIDEGRVGMIYSVVVDASASSATESHIPPLVVKICVPGQTSDMLNEAASYDEMEATNFPVALRFYTEFIMQVLQGVCIPRCYGLFQTSYVSDELDFPIMAERKARDEKLRREAEEDLDEDEPLEPVVYDDLVTVILMERVGDRLKLGSPLPHGVRCVFLLPGTYLRLILLQRRHD